MQGKTRLKVWSVLVAVFVLGSVTGAALNGVYRMRTSAEHDQGGRRQAYFDKMRRELNLTNEQATQIVTILDETGKDIVALRQKKRERIRAVLNPEQQQKFDQMIARKDAARETHDRDK
jgi:Spy/CpxP family protein refolding chaperone